MDGLLAITSLFKNRGTSRDVKMKVVEFLYFYLMPETPAVGGGWGGGGGGGELQRGPSKKVGNAGGIIGPSGRELKTRTTDEKQGLLGRHLSNVEDLVEDLRESAPFGAILA